ncbi:MAG: ADP-ribosylglycohydrolase family protein [Armatimonadetes bacterium]|nr:ADP-ribosylglycohydrolase family protein [Armatimonadota bacterium]
MTAHELHGLMGAELTQRAEEGCAVDGLRAEWDRLRERPAAEVAAETEALWTLVDALPSPTEDQEPSSLEAIRALRPDGPRRMSVDGAALADRVHGALLGRIAGCQLGKPVEGWHKTAIDAYLDAAGESEIREYLPLLETVPDGVRKLGCQECTRGRLHGASRDDDLIMLGRKGAAVSPGDVADGWLDLLPFGKVYTAERVAYRNLVAGLRPTASATYRNPYREWIGAQIRADGWAYAAAGCPELAAELAWRDAVVSHVKNGIYGEMLFAAMIAAAFATDDVEEAILAGVAEIPGDCRLAACVHDMLAWRRDEPTWRGCWDRLNERYGHYHGVHTINNAALVLLGLLYGEQDLGATVGIAVHGGWDTDCNGATAGSVLGAMLGARALPAQWVDPLDGRVASALFGYADNRIEDLATWALELRRTVTG